MSFLKMFSFFSGEKTQWSLTQLPSDFLVRLFRELDSVRDVVALQSTCRLLRDIGCSRPVWTHRLRKEYGLAIEADQTCQEGNLQKLFRETSGVEVPLRFWGVFTDGGCDNQWLHYWMDNLFTPNHWNSFCSETGRNVNCVGVLIDGDIQRDIEAQNDRRYMLHKCRIPASQIFNEPIGGGAEEAVQKLMGWSHQDLAHFMVALYHDMEAGGAWGELLLHGVPRRQILAEKAYMREFVQKLERVMALEDAGIESVEYLGEEALQERKAHPLSTLYDTTFTAVARSQPEAQLTGVFDSVTVSRQGAFSCPVLSGVLFATQMNIKDYADSDSTMTQALEALCRSEMCSAFDDQSDLSHIQSAISKHRLPPARRFCTSSSGSWIEFDSDHPSLKFDQLRPVVWFRFYEKEENRRQHNQTVPWDDADSDEEALSASSDAASIADTIIFDNELELMDDIDMQQAQVDGEEDFPRHDADKDILVMQLSKNVSANVVVLKLICPEDRMAEHGDHHSEPNIDINYLKLLGRKITMPTGVRFCR